MVYCPCLPFALCSLLTPLIIFFYQLKLQNTCRTVHDHNAIHICKPLTPKVHADKFDDSLSDYISARKKSHYVPNQP